MLAARGSPFLEAVICCRGNRHGLRSAVMKARFFEDFNIFKPIDDPAHQFDIARTLARPSPALKGAGADCQSAFKFDPVSASNFNPFERRVLTVALASSELAGVAETWRARVV